MNRRNFKVRIKNTNLKDTFMLVHSPTEYDLYEKYDAMLTKQGYCMVTHAVDGTCKTYTYYPTNLEIKHRKEARAKNRTRSGKPRARRPGAVGGRRLIRPSSRLASWRKPEFLVFLEITMLHPTPKYRL
jgi:hypothetical protein